MQAPCGCLPLAPCPPPFLSVDEFWTFATALDLNSSDVAGISDRCYGSREPNYDVTADKGGNQPCGRTCVISLLSVLGILLFVLIGGTFVRVLIKRYHKIKGSINSSVRMRPLAETNIVAVEENRQEQNEKIKIKSESCKSIDQCNGFLNPMYHSMKSKEDQIDGLPAHYDNKTFTDEFADSQCDHAKTDTNGTQQTKADDSNIVMPYDNVKQEETVIETNTPSNDKDSHSKIDSDKNVSSKSINGKTKEKIEESKDNKLFKNGQKPKTKKVNQSENNPSKVKAKPDKIINGRPQVNGVKDSKANGTRVNTSFSNGQSGLSSGHGEANGSQAKKDKRGTNGEKALDRKGLTNGQSLKNGQYGNNGLQQQNGNHTNSTFLTNGHNHNNVHNYIEESSRL